MQQRIVEDAIKSWTFEITDEHVVKAKAEILELEKFCPDDPKKCKANNCVVVQAITDALSAFGTGVGVFEGISVGTRVLKIYMVEREIRFSTPECIRRAILHFDKTGEWGLVPGRYTLLPLAPSYRKDYVRPKVSKKKKTKPQGPRRANNPRQVPMREARRSGKMTPDEVSA